MVANVDKMSDAEIRTKLMEYGFPVMPITGTTRNLMAKKLKFLMIKKPTNDRKSLGQFSSEEESDTDAAILKKNKNRRVTMAAPQVSSSRSNPIIRKSGRSNNSVNDISEAASTSKRDFISTTSKVTKSVLDEFDTGSDSDLEIIPDDNELPSTVTNSVYKQRDAGRSSYSSISSPSRGVSGRASNVPTDYRPSSSTSSNLSNLQQIRSRLSLGSPGFDRPISTSSPINDQITTPYLSNFAHRLNQLSSVSPRPKFDYKNDLIKEQDTNGSGTYGRRPTRHRDVNVDYNSRNQRTVLKDNWVSISVFGAFFLFFAAVIVMYLRLRSDESALDIVDYIVPNCNEFGDKQQEGVNCLYDRDVAGALRLMKRIKPELTKASTAYACQYALSKPFMTETEIIKFQHKQSNEKMVDISRHLRHLEILILKNPEWGISLIPVDESNELNFLKSVDEVIAARAQKEIGLAVLDIDVPWTCIMYTKLSQFFYVGLFILGIYGIFYLLNYVYDRYKKSQQQHKEELGNLIEQIVEVIQTHSDEDYLIINHVRELIIPAIDRKRLSGLWDEAVKFINENDSRVRCETQNVQGEVFRVWRWLGSSTLNTSGSPRSRTWQGQAFETQQGSVNSLPYSPTPCLKIRGMVDDNEENYSVIKEAVLSKCSEECRILHCAVDKTSKCVYLKCTDQKQAAIAYQNLHGWWYAGHLVTVKYLRLERYMQRYPDSPATGPPFL